MTALKFSPIDGTRYIRTNVTAQDFRDSHPTVSWGFNPWTGAPRPTYDVVHDPKGRMIVVSPDSLLHAAALLDAQPVPTEDRMVHDGMTLHGEVKDTANPKDAAGRAKVPLWLLSPIAKAAWAGAAFIGRVKYGAWNYRGTKVYVSVYISAAMRHLDAYLSGETYDPEDGTHHLGNVMACCAILLDCAASGNLIDDRPPSVSLRLTYDEMQALVQPTEAKYADKIVKHWTIDDTTTNRKETT